MRFAREGIHIHRNQCGKHPPISVGDSSGSKPLLLIHIRAKFLDQVAHLHIRQFFDKGFRFLPGETL
jgi:hypothetical protein